MSQDTNLSSSIAGTIIAITVLLIIVSVYNHSMISDMIGDAPELEEYRYEPPTVIEKPVVYEVDRPKVVRVPQIVKVPEIRVVEKPVVYTNTVKEYIKVDRPVVIEKIVTVEKPVYHERIVETVREIPVEKVIEITKYEPVGNFSNPSRAGTHIQDKFGKVGYILTADSRYVFIEWEGSDKTTRYSLVDFLRKMEAGDYAR